MGDMIEFARPDGQTAPAYVAKAGDGAPSIVLIQEWWGLNPQIKSTADRLAAAGFTTLVPDLYRGRLTTDADEANHMMTGLDWGDATSQDLAGAITHLRNGGGKVGVMGFCMGGALTILASVNLAPDAAVCFYGIPPAEAADPSKITNPLLCHFASDDDWCNADAIAGLKKSLEAGSVDATVHVYDGTQHAFFNEARPEVHNKDAAELAWTRSIEFFENRLR